MKLFIFAWLGLIISQSIIPECTGMFYDLLELARSRQIFNARRDVILKLRGPGQLSNCSNPPLGVRVSEDASPDHNMAATKLGRPALIVQK